MEALLIPVSNFGWLIMQIINMLDVLQLEECGVDCMHRLFEWNFCLVEKANVKIAVWLISAD
jgi:hypothetical protein